jgi:hypothetical protein
MRYAAVMLIIHSIVAISKMLYFHATGQPVMPPPFLAIPVRYGWLYSAYLQIPIDFVQAIVFAGTVTLFAPLLGGKGSFRGQFSLYALAFVPPTIILILATFALTLLGLGETLVWWLVFVSIFLWILASIVEAVSIEQDLNHLRAIAVSCIGFVPAIGISLTYIR